MGLTVFTENLGFFHKGSGGFGIAPGDVCLSPPPPPTGPVPVPYVNSLQASDLSKGSKSVKIDGEPTALEDISYVSTSTGDEGGTLGVDELADAKHTEPGTIAHRYATADRGGIEIGKQRLFLGQRIGGRSIGIGREVATDEKVAETADDASGGLFHFRVAGRAQAAEARRPIVPAVSSSPKS